MGALPLLAIVLGILAVPAAVRSRRFRSAGDPRRACVEAARAVLAIAGALAVLAIAVLTKGRPA